MTNILISKLAVEKVKNFTINDPHIGFGKYISPIMIQGVYRKGKWEKFELIPYGPLSLDPCTKVLHYGQEIFEGMKVFKHADGSIQMFRPELNARRFNHSARRMAMPEVPENIFLEACEVISSYSSHLVPKRLGESLYLRPFMIATEIGLGIKPSQDFLFLIVASPAGAYFSNSSVKVYIEREEIRCAPGGVGSAKTGGNYASSLRSYQKILSLGLDQTLWLDALEHKYIEEMSGMNFFAVMNGKLVTPELTDTILDGITRKSIIELARSGGFEVEERKISIHELIEKIENKTCTEAFVCGTAAVITPISSFSDDSGDLFKLPEGDGKISLLLKEKLIHIQAGREKAPKGWNYPVRSFHKEPS